MTARAMPGTAVRRAAALPTLATAALAFAVFAASALLFSQGEIGSGSPEAVALAALVLAVILPKVRPLLERRVRSPGGQPGTAYEAVAAVTSRLERAVPLDSALAAVADGVRRGVNADRVEVTTAGETADGGRPLSDFSVPIAGPDGGRLGEIAIFKSAGLTAREVRLVEEVAAASAIAVSNVLVARQLERRAEELAATAEAIAASLRQTVIAEQAHRRALAERVGDELAPIFDDIRGHIRAGALDEAAGSAERLIDALRSVSASVLEGAAA